MASLATRTPVQHAVGFTVMSNADEVATSLTRFALASINGHFIGRSGVFCLVMHMCKQRLLGKCQQFAALRALHFTNACPWVHFTCPHNFAAKHVANSGHHTLIKQHFRDSCIFVFILHHAINAFFNINIVMTQVGAKLAKDWMSTRIKVAEGFQTDCSETHCDPIRNCDYNLCTFAWLRPLLSAAIQVPRT